MADTADVTMREMRRGVRSLGVVATTAPLVGCIGATLGIMGSFRGGCGEKATLLAAFVSDVADSLALQAWGIALAILVWWAYRYFHDRLDEFAGQMQVTSSAILSDLAELTTTLATWPPRTA